MKLELLIFAVFAEIVYVENRVIVTNFDKIGSYDGFGQLEHSLNSNQANADKQCTIVVLANGNNPTDLNNQSVLRKYRYDAAGKLIPNSVQYFIKINGDQKMLPLSNTQGFPNINRYNTIRQPKTIAPKPDVSFATKATKGVTPKPMIKKRKPHFPHLFDEQYLEDHVDDHSNHNEDQNQYYTDN